MFIGGSKVAAFAAGWIGALFTGGLSLVIAAGGNAALNAAFTRAFGKACAKYFLQSHRIDDSDVIVKVLIALVGIELGINMGNREYITA